MATVKPHPLKQVYFDPIELVIVLWWEDTKEPSTIQCVTLEQAKGFLEQVNWKEPAPLSALKAKT